MQLHNSIHVRITHLSRGVTPQNQLQTPQDDPLQTTLMLDNSPGQKTLT
jgi:hypothetical protein